jgi:hypothetical protein
MFSTEQLLSLLSRRFPNLLIVRRRTICNLETGDTVGFESDLAEIQYVIRSAFHLLGHGQAMAIYALLKRVKKENSAESKARRPAKSSTSKPVARKRSPHR